MKRMTFLGVTLAILLALVPGRVRADEKWTEIKSTNFAAWSNAGDRQTRDLLWQFEQIRFAVGALWPWARLDLSKPTLIVIVKDEQSMKALAPRYWEEKGGVRPVSVWVTGPDQHHMVIRADLRGEEGRLINPYHSAYFSYVSLILASSFKRELPLWFQNGLAGVQSNTIVRDNQILLGVPIPWHLDRLQTDSRLKLSELVQVVRSSRDYTQGEARLRFDAQAWALVHFLMFGQDAKRREAINTFAQLLSAGSDPESSFSKAFGPIEAMENDFAAYINRGLYTYQQFELNKKTARDKFTSRPLPPAVSAAGLASVHVALGRPKEARALIDEARKADPNLGDAYAAEAQLLLREDKPDDANAAFAKAASLGSTNASVYYRVAMSKWRPAGVDDATLQQIEGYLTRATELNPLHAQSYAALAEVRAALKKPTDDVDTLLIKAVNLDQSDPWIRLSAARTLWRLGKLDEARNVAQIALVVAGSDARAKAEAERLLATIPEKK